MSTEKHPTTTESLMYTENPTHTETEPRTVKALLSETFSNLSPEQIDCWYETIFTKPDLATIENEMDQVLQKLTTTDLINLATAFTEGTLPGICTMKRCFWSLLGISSVPESMTIHEWITQDPQRAKELNEDNTSAMLYYYSLDDNGEITESWLLINPTQLNGIQLGMILYSGAHEAWHAYQSVQVSAAHKAGLHRINMENSPKTATRAQLYMLNQSFYANPDIDGYEAYAQQILESEAFLFGAKMVKRIQELIYIIKDPALTAKFNRTITITD